MHDSSEKILQRQRICLKCKSFVTHEKDEEGNFTCPLCNNVQHAPKSQVQPISVGRMRKIVRKYFDDRQKQGASPQAGDERQDQGEEASDPFEAAQAESQDQGEEASDPFEAAQAESQDQGEEASDPFEAAQAEQNASSDQAEAESQDEEAFPQKKDE